jgi:hypothetical protein
LRVEGRHASPPDVMVELRDRSENARDQRTMVRNARTRRVVGAVKLVWIQSCRQVRVIPRLVAQCGRISAL